ncbi:hypothetical protein T4E_3852, partial [Trichinella pseudospiralis]
MKKKTIRNCNNKNEHQLEQYLYVTVGVGCRAFRRTEKQQATKKLRERRHPDGSEPTGVQLWPTVGWPCRRSP